MRFPRIVVLLALLGVSRTGFAFSNFNDSDWLSLAAGPGVTNGNKIVSAVVADTNRNLIYIGGSFGAVGSTLATNIAAWNGTNWLAITKTVNGQVNALAFDASGNLYAGGAFSNINGTVINHIAKWDGTNWSSLGAGVNGTVNAIAADSIGNIYVGGTFAQANGITASNVARWDGNSWSALGSGIAGGIGLLGVNSLAVDGSGNVIVGGLFSKAGGQAITNIAKWDGSTWSALGAGFNNEVAALKFDGSGTLYAGGRFTASGTNSMSLIATWNGSAWTGFYDTNIVGEIVAAIAFDTNGSLYIGGNLISAYNRYSGPQLNGVARWTGSAWAPLSQGIGQSGSVVSGLAFDAKGILYAGGTWPINYNAVGNAVLAWDGVSWKNVYTNNLTLLYPLSALALNKNGLLYAAGNSGPVIFGSNGWQFLGTNFGATITAQSMLFDASSNLYLGGIFNAIGGVSATNLARWDGTNWFPVGSGVPLANVYALALDSKGNLYAGGNGVAKWDGTNWTSLNLSGYIYTLYVDRSDALYAGGTISGYGNLAKWDGANWSSPGGGANGGVYAVTADKVGNIYAFGTFSQIGSVSANGIARWNGNNWSPLGNGISHGLGPPFSLTVDAFGNVYAGGGSQNVSVWDGNSWTSLGSGTDRTPYTMITDGTNHLYFGGTFVRAGTNFSMGAAEALIPIGPGPLAIKSANASVIVSAQGLAGNISLLQTSSDLLSWTTISTNIFDTNGIWNYTNAVMPSSVFFRTKSP